MAKGFGEPPQLSVWTHLEGLEFPVSREEIVEAAEDNEASLNVINFLKALPRDSYVSLEVLLRDFAEAARRFALGPDKPAWQAGDRRNIGRDAVEMAPAGQTRHP
jgi:hypothetical protein